MNSKVLYLTSQKEIETFPSFSVALFCLEAGVISIIFEKKKRGHPKNFLMKRGEGVIIFYRSCPLNPTPLPHKK